MDKSCSGYMKRMDGNYFYTYIRYAKVGRRRKI